MIYYPCLFRRCAWSFAKCTRRTSMERAGWQWWWPWTRRTRVWGRHGNGLPNPRGNGTQADITVEDTSTQTPQDTPLALPAGATHHPPMGATMARPPLPMPPTSKRQRTGQSSTAARRGQDEEQPTAKMRIRAVTITTKKGYQNSRTRKRFYSKMAEMYTSGK